MPEADQHLSIPGNNFVDSQFSLIGQLNNTDLNKGLLTFRLKKRDGFWIRK